MKKDLLAALRHGEELTLRQQTTMALQLSIPAILAQLSSIAMQYIDSSMVGHLGREASAAIGLVASSTWLLMGLCRALTVGFCVQTAQRIGAGEERDARNLVKQSLLVGVAFGMVLAALSAALAGCPSCRNTSFSRMGVRIVPPTTVITTGVIMAALSTPMDKPRFATISATSPRQTMPTPT